MDNSMRGVRSPEVEGALGDVLLRLDRREEAVAAYERALALIPWATTVTGAGTESRGGRVAGLLDRLCRLHLELTNPERALELGLELVRGV